MAPYAPPQDATHLYQVSPAVKGEVGPNPRRRRVAKASAGGAATDVFASADVRRRSLAFADGKLFWGDLGASPSDVANQRLISGTPGRGECCTTVASAQDGIEHVALAGGKGYWSASGGGAARGKSADGTGGVTRENGFQTSPSWLSVDADAVAVLGRGRRSGQGREVRRAVSASAAEPVASGGAGLRAVELFGERVYWADGAAVRSRPKASPTEAPREEFAGAGAVEGFAVVAAAGGGGAAGAAGAGGGGGGGATLYALTAEGRKLRAWRKGPGDDAPLLLSEVTAKADPYGGNSFGAAYVRVDAQYVYFADIGTVDITQVVPTSEGDGAVYRVAR